MQSIIIKSKNCYCIAFVYVITTFLSFIGASAQITVEIAKINNDKTVETSNYPALSASIRASRNGSSILLNSSNINIVEGNFSSRPFKVDPISNNYQKVYWHSHSRGISSSANNVLFVITDAKDIGFVEGKYSMTSDVQARFKDLLATPVFGLYFGNISPGNDTTLNVTISAQTTRTDLNQNSLRIDSITTQTPYFTWVWKGSSIVSSKTPPTYIQSPFRYSIEITFRPDAPRYFRDILTVHYEGGAEEYLELKGNTFVLPQNTILNITKPNAKQNFSPCQSVDIQWIGSVAGSPVFVDYSIDGGKQWQNIGQTLDSVYHWIIPTQYTDSLLFRARQDFSNFSEVKLRDEIAGAYTLAYDGKGENFAVAYENGDVREYDVASQTVLQKYSVGEIDYPDQKAEFFGLSYIGSHRLAAGLRLMNGTQKLVFFVPGTSSPQSSTVISAPVKFNKFIIDPSGKEIICIPEFGNLLYAYSTLDGSLLRTISFLAPITAFTLNPDGNGAVAMLDGTIARISAPNYSTTDPIKFPELPIINRITLSPNNQLLGIAIKTSLPTISSSSESAVYIVDITSKTIIRSLHKTSSDALNLVFNGTSRYLGLGFQYQPQVALWQIIDDSFNRGLSGHAGKMTSITYSPNGRSIATTALSPDNVALRNFSYPEADVSDELMRIVPADITVGSPLLKPNYLMNVRDTTLRATICNNGASIILFESAKLISNKHFALLKPITLSDTLYPGKCMDIAVRFQPKDTGLLHDTLMLASCSREFPIAIQGYSYDRSMNFLANNLDFGKWCVGDSIVREIEILRNNDPVPLEIDQLSVENGFTSGFSFVPPITKTILQPGEILRATVRFYPKTVGNDITKIFVMHSGQWTYVPTFIMNGTGIGATLEMLSDIRFIPEIPTRAIKIKNSSPNEVVLRSITPPKASSFTFFPDLPLTIPVQGEIVLNITSTEPLTELGEALDAELNPCIVQKIIIAGAYSGTSTVSAPTVEADPRKNVEIPIQYRNTENKPYNGIRFFEGEISLNPRLFLPVKAESEYGTAEITKNEIVGDKRIISFRTEGDFPLAGTAVKIIGLTGLAETDRTKIEFSTTAKYWGTAVKTVVSSSELHILNTCGGCSILQNTSLTIVNISPNPARDEVVVNFYAPTSGNFSIEVLNEVGRSVVSPISMSAATGLNSALISLASLQIGAYRVVARGISGDITSSLLIVQ